MILTQHSDSTLDTAFIRVSWCLKLMQVTLCPFLCIYNVSIIWDLHAVKCSVLHLHGSPMCFVKLIILRLVQPRHSSWAEWSCFVVLGERHICYGILTISYLESACSSPSERDHQPVYYWDDWCVFYTCRSSFVSRAIRPWMIIRKRCGLGSKVTGLLAA